MDPAGFAAGARALGEGLRTIARERTLWPYVAAPVAIAPIAMSERLQRGVTTAQVAGCCWRGAGFAHSAS